MTSRYKKIHPVANSRISDDEYEYPRWRMHNDLV